MTNWMTRLTEPLPRAPLFLEELAWPQVQALQESGMKTLLLPIGATEQHGPHLPLNTDSVIATAACAYASALTGVPVLPTVRISVSIGHTEKWPGTFAIFHETLIDTIKDIARWCAATGWKQLVLVNSHFGNDAALRVAVDRLRFNLVGQFAIATRNTVGAVYRRLQCRFHGGRHRLARQRGGDGSHDVPGARRRCALKPHLKPLILTAPRAVFSRGWWPTPAPTA